MNPWLVALSTLLGVAGAMLLYLASPQQQWRRQGPWPARHGGWPGSACALLSLLVALRILPPFEAIAAWSVLLALVLSIAPFLGAWRAAGRRGDGA